MKRILFTLFLLFSFTLISNAQIMQFKTTGYYERTHYSWGWGNWSSKKDSNMNITINLSTDVITIYSPRTQIYYIYQYNGTYTDSDGDTTAEYKFYDQDSDRGTMRLVIRRNGKSQIYIDFANISWAYDVYRLY